MPGAPLGQTSEQNSRVLRSCTGLSLKQVSPVPAGQSYWGSSSCFDEFACLGNQTMSLEWVLWCMGSLLCPAMELLHAFGQVSPLQCAFPSQPLACHVYLDTKLFGKGPVSHYAFVQHLVQWRDLCYWRESRSNLEASIAVLYNNMQPQFSSSPGVYGGAPGISFLCSGQRMGLLLSRQNHSAVPASMPTACSWRCLHDMESKEAARLQFNKP